MNIRDFLFNNSVFSLRVVNRKVSKWKKKELVHQLNTNICSYFIIQFVWKQSFGDRLIYGDFRYSCCKKRSFGAFFNSARCY